jgi:hypothetical protein
LHRLVENGQVADLFFLSNNALLIVDYHVLGSRSVCASATERIGVSQSPDAAAGEKVKLTFTHKH